jgi:hypothetical protein
MRELQGLNGLPPPLPLADQGRIGWGRLWEAEGWFVVLEMWLPMVRGFLAPLAAQVQRMGSLAIRLSLSWATKVTLLRLMGTH